MPSYLLKMWSQWTSRPPVSVSSFRHHVNFDAVSRDQCLDAETVSNRARWGIEDLLETISTRHWAIRLAPISSRLFRKGRFTNRTVGLRGLFTGTVLFHVLVPTWRSRSKSISSALSERSSFWQTQIRRTGR